MDGFIYGPEDVIKSAVTTLQPHNPSGSILPSGAVTRREMDHAGILEVIQREERRRIGHVHDEIREHAYNSARNITTLNAFTATDVELLINGSIVAITSLSMESHTRDLILNVERPIFDGVDRYEVGLNYAVTLRMRNGPVLVDEILTVTGLSVSASMSDTLINERLTFSR